MWYYVVTMPFVSDIYRYPVKSLGGEHLAAVHIGPYGIEGDRKYMVVDQETGEFVSQKHKDMSRMATVRPRLADGALWLSIDGLEASVDESDFQVTSTAALYGNEVPAIWTAEASEAEQLLSEVFLRELRLVRADTNRTISERRQAEGFSRFAHFPDSSQLHITTKPSLLAVNDRRIDSTLPPLNMASLRPNLVLASEDGDLKAFDEDRLRQMQIFGTEIVDILINGPTVRCALTEIDQSTGLRGTRALKIMNHAGRLGVERSTHKTGLWFGIYGSPSEYTDAMIASHQRVVFSQLSEEPMVEFDNK